MSRGSTLYRSKLKALDKFTAPLSSVLLVTSGKDEHKLPRKERRKLVRVRQRLFRGILKKVGMG